MEELKIINPVSSIKFAAQKEYLNIAINYLIVGDIPKFQLNLHNIIVNNVLGVKNSKIILNFDKDGILREIEKREKIFKK